MNLICIPFAYEENMNSGVNVSIKGKRQNRNIFKECLCGIDFG